MSECKPTHLRGWIALTVGLCLPLIASAQVPTPYHTATPYGPYGPYGAYWDNSGGNYLYGASSVIQAQGQYLIDRQKAYSQKEQAMQDKVRTRKMIFDQRLYEMQHTPSKEQVREMNRQRAVTRAMQPPEDEIMTAQSLNTLLNEFEIRQGMGAKGPQIPVSQEMLDEINVTTGGVQGDKGEIALLKDGGKLDWPIQLQDPQFDVFREPLTDSFAEAAQAAQRGSLTAAQIRDVQQKLDNFVAALQAKVNDISMGDYIRAKQYLDRIQKAVDGLSNPAIVKMLQNGETHPKGDNVAEVVKYMGEHGLEFAPALPGNEPAYLAFHRALANYGFGIVSSLKTAGGPTGPNN